MSQPYATPQSLQQSGPAPHQKSTICTVFGILSLIAGGLALLFTGLGIANGIIMFSEPIPIPPNSHPVMEQVIEVLGTPEVRKMQIIMYAVDFLFAGGLVISGFLLLKQTSAGRSLSLVYCVSKISF